jgi:putative ABC transport system permease protein
MFIWLYLPWRNAFRQRLRTMLTLIGLVVVIVAYGLLDTVVQVWYANAEAASANRLMTRSAISLAYPLPAHYGERIQAVPGVTGVTWVTWFGGRYGDQARSFPRFAVDAKHYFELFPEYRLSDEQKQAFLHDKQGAVVGAQIARLYGFKVGDVIPIQGDQFPGNWAFTVRGIYQPRDDKTDDTLMIVHGQHVADTLSQKLGAAVPELANVFVVGVADAAQGDAVARRIDALFANSPHVTRTESERSYQLSIVNMSRNVLAAIRLVSVGLVIAIMAVMANTMSMSAAERLGEFATLKVLGFKPRMVAATIFGESLVLALLGGSVGMALTYPASAVFIGASGGLAKGFDVATPTLIAQAVATVLVGLVGGAWPAWTVARVNVARALARQAV